MGGGPKNDLREPLLQGSEGERLEGLSAADAPTTYEDLVGNVQQEVLAVVQRPEEYQPDYEDLVAAYPWAFQAQEDLRQRLHDSEGVVLDLEQQLHETYALIERLRGRLRNAERFGQEYVERSDEASRALSERCKEIEELEMALREVRRENFGLNARVQRQEAEEVPGQEQPTVRRVTYQDAREAHRHVQESGGSLSPRDPTVQGPPPELAVRYAGDEVWLVPVQAVQPEGDRGDEDSELEGATTSSGEYTIRERSSDSSGGYKGGDAEETPCQESRSPRSTGGSVSGRLVAAATLAASISSADSSSGEVRVCGVERGRDAGESHDAVMWVFVVFLSGWTVGLVSVWLWCVCCRRTMAAPRSMVHVQIDSTINAVNQSDETSRVRASVRTSPEQELRLPWPRRERFKARPTIHMYTTAGGACVHTTPECSALRGKEVQDRTVCQKCAGKALRLH